MNLSGRDSPLSRALPCLLAAAPRAFSRRRRRPSFGRVAPPSPPSPPLAVAARGCAKGWRRPAAASPSLPATAAPSPPANRAAAAILSLPVVVGRRSALLVSTVGFVSSSSTCTCPPNPQPVALSPARSSSWFGRH